MSASRRAPECEAAREAVHATLDSEPAEVALEQSLERHLARCEGCRRFAAEMRALQTGLRALPTLAIPTEVLERVRTHATGPVRSRTRVPAWGWAAAAAALLVVGLAGFWLRNGTTPAGPTETELREASHHARLVLGIASRALNRTERAAVRDVLGDEVSGALRRMPVRWPDHDGVDATERREP